MTLDIKMTPVIDKLWNQISRHAMIINMFVNRFKVCKQAEKGYSRLMLEDLQLDSAGKSNAQSELHFV